MPTVETSVRNSASRDVLISMHADMARRIARRMARRCPSWVTKDDLVSAAMVGLVEAADRFDENRGDPFPAFAELRIRGAVLDEMRRDDTLPRRVRGLARKARSVIHALEATNTEVTDERIAQQLGVDVESYRERVAWALRHEVTTLEEDTTRGPDHDVDRRCELEHVRAAMATLCDRDVDLLGKYFVDELTYLEIGRSLNITASRVCQLMQRAIARLRDALGVDATSLAA